MAQLPIVQIVNPVQDVMLLETKWKSQLDPILANQLLDGLLIVNQVLVTGTNVINHKLGRLQVGWNIVDQNASAAIYRTKPFNNLTLTLTSSAPATINLWVF